MTDIQLYRQPLFSTSGALLGYEIRFRDAGDGGESMVQSFVDGTFDAVRGKRPAFVSFTRTQLLSDVIQLVDPASAILLLPSDLTPDDDVRDALAKVAERNGTVALDGITPYPNPTEVLAPLATWIRIDMRSGTFEELDAAKERVRQLCGSTQPQFVADYVDDQATYEIALELGATAYQGVFFSRPEPLPAADFPQSTVSAMRLLGLARDPKVNDRQLEEVISTDPVLMFQLLRLVNSAAVGLQGVSSIGQALRMIGRNTFQRWLAVAVAASRKSTTGVDAELVRQAVERGRLMEQLAGRDREAGTLFLVGLFSLLDAVFRMPLPDIVERVALSDEAAQALLDRAGPYADALAFAESYELGLFEHASELARDMGVDPDQVSGMYTTAISWTEDALGSALEPTGKTTASAKVPVRSR